jgi:hypothetical protein
MEAHDIRGTLDQLPDMEFRQLAPFNRGHVGVFWCTAGTSPWERHPEERSPGPATCRPPRIRVPKNRRRHE